MVQNIFKLYNSFKNMDFVKNNNNNNKTSLMLDCFTATAQFMVAYRFCNIFSRQQKNTFTVSLFSSLPLQYTYVY